MSIIEEGLKSLLKMETDLLLEYWVTDLVGIAAKRSIVRMDLEALLQTKRVNVLVNDSRIVLSIPYRRGKVLLKLIRDLLTSKGFTVV